MLLAMANRAEEQSPWAIIMARAPWCPHKVLVIRPAVSSPMCPTEE